jgi:hypothetical protein
MAQMGSGSAKRELLPENESSFFTRDEQRQTFSFVKDDKGQVTFLVVQVEGREVGRAKKIK